MIFGTIGGGIFVLVAFVATWLFVRARANELADRNAEMRVLLDNVGLGFVTIDASGRMGPERSAALDKWFGAPREPRERLADYLGRVDRNTGLWIALGCELLASGEMPREVALAALPVTFAKRNRHYRLDYTPLATDGERITSVLVAITDVTEAFARERAEEMRRDVYEAFEKALVDRSGFLAFHTEAEQIIGAILSGDLARSDEQRGLHTLKGNAGLFGLRSFGRFCHTLEARLLEGDVSLTVRDRVALAARWKGATNRVSAIFSRRRDRVDVSQAELDALEDGLVSGAPRRALARRVHSWRLESFDVRLARFAELARELAERLGKSGLVVDTYGASVRFDPAAWTPFWTAFVHVIRNAVDHGIESPEERIAHGKPAEGRLLIDVAVEREHLVLTVADDGPGIDWGRLSERAAERGLSTSTHAERVAALFADGVSTARAISETSGRGVGMSAVREACAQLGGKVEVETARRAGTRFRFVFPREVFGTVYEGVDDLAGREGGDVAA
jgi:two-component system chemotaxis sensor kinase CheA